jgi:hypothetical protein
VTVTPSADFSGGGVTLGVDGLPAAGVTATFTPAQLTMASSPQTIKLDLHVASDAAVAPSLALSIKASSGAISGATPLALTIPAELLITVAKGVQIGSSANPDLTAWGGTSSLTVKFVPGLKVTFENLDTINHQVHAQNSANLAGIAHEGGPLMANGANVYTQTIKGPATIKANDIHCHIHPNMIGPTINIQ